MVKTKTSIAIDENIWRKTKIYCINKKINISDLIENLLKKEVKDKNKEQ